MSKKSLGSLLFTMRMGRGLTQTEAAKAVGVTQGCWSKIETGEIELGFKEAKRLENAFGWDMKFLAEELISSRQGPVLRKKKESRIQRLQRLSKYFSEETTQSG